MAVNQVNTLIPPKAPRLPIAPVEYDQRFIDEFIRILRLYFNQLDNFSGGMLSGDGGQFISFPYGAFASYVDQTTTANTATLMTLNTTDFANGVSIASSKITTQYAGIYNLQFSTQFQNTDNQLQDISIWLRQNGVDIAGSTGFVSIPAKAGAIEAHEIIGWNYYVSMAAGDYIEIYWSTTNASVTIQTYPTSVSPTRPSTASVVATLTFVSSV